MYQWFENETGYKYAVIFVVIMIYMAEMTELIGGSLDGDEGSHKEADMVRSAEIVALFCNDWGWNFGLGLIDGNLFRKQSARETR